MQEYVQKLVDAGVLVFDNEFTDDENSLITLYSVVDGYSVILETVDDEYDDRSTLIKYIGEVYENVNGAFITFICIDEDDDEIEIDGPEGHIRIYKQIII